MTDEAKALVERLRELERDLKPFEHKTVGSIRIDLDEVRAIIGCPDLIETQAREIERLQATLRHIARTKIEMVKADHANITLPFELPYFSAQQCWDMARAALGESHD